MNYSKDINLNEHLSNSTFTTGYVIEKIFENDENFRNHSNKHKIKSVIFWVLMSSN